MVRTDLHREGMSDLAKMSERLGEEYTNKRRAHLKDLEPIEALARDLAPLPISYDVGRAQPPFFSEFTYTECLGGLLISPQSREVAARQAAAASATANPMPCDPVKFIMDRLAQVGTLDKYKLSPPSEPRAKRIIFAPGTNLFAKVMSREGVSRLMFEDPQVYLKLHPLTHPDHMRDLGREFGFDRLLPPEESGWAYLDQAEVIYSASTTELALYAVLMGKRVANVGNFFTEAQGVYYPFFRLISGREPGEARADLIAALSSPCSGFFYPGVPDLQKRMRVYFDNVIALRELFRPLAPDMPTTKG